jgi:hypothetical protein
VDMNRTSAAILAGRGRHERAGFAPPAPGYDTSMLFLLWLAAVILVIAGIVSLVRGQVVAGILLIVVGLLVGPGGVSVFA